VLAGKGRASFAPAEGRGSLRSRGRRAGLKASPTSAREENRYFAFVDVPSMIGIHFLSGPSTSHLNVYDAGETTFRMKRAL
jgi:hypothetical protein